jgi:hypothetical protein
MVNTAKKALALGLLVAAALGAWAQAPTKLGDLAIYSGAILMHEELAPPESGIRGGVRRTYVITAAPEAVVAFYEKACGVKARFLEPEDENGLAVGKATAATSQVYYWQDEEFVDADYGAGGSSKRAWIKKALQARSKDGNEGWVESANLQWYYRQSADSMATLHLMVQDMSIDEEAGSYALATELIVEYLHYDYEP